MNLIQKGSQEFVQKWGNRKLEDNWRRSSANNMSASSEDEEDGESGQITASDIASLLKQLPKTPAQMDACNAKLQEAFYNLGLTYYSQLADYPNAIKTFDTLISRFPNTSYKKQAYYALYLNHNKLQQLNEANRYKNLLNQEFPGTELAQLALNPEYKSPETIQTQSANQHYENTYALYKSAAYNDALSQVQYAKTNFKGHPLIPKYQLVEAISYAGLKQMDTCKSLLEKIVLITPKPKNKKEPRKF